MFKLKFVVIILFALLINSRAETFNFSNCSTLSDTTIDVFNFSNLNSDVYIFRKIHKDVPTISINIALKKNKDTFFPVQRLIFKDSATNQEIQIIDSEKDSVAIVNLEFNDFNFDGYVDLYVYDGCAILANCHGKVFIYNEGLNKFVHDYGFDEMTSVQVDKKKKEIRSFNQCCAGANSEEKVYKYFDRKLTLIKEIFKNWDNKKSKFVYTINRYNKKGKLIKTRTIITDEYDLDE
ncbi:MAG: hypothetical protein NTU73_15135 [Ignavibacteriae bacterium]|nr:hypothetical protein [Ignavibacteriota bacterium]